MEDNIRLCNHCNNVTSHKLIDDGYSNKIIGEKIIDDRKEKIKKDFTYFFVKCDTCGEHSLLGCFNDQFSNPKLADIPVLFPKSNELDPSVPQNIRKVYETAYQIRNTIPDAFAGQIRKAIEYLCKDRNAKGKNLEFKLKSLVDMGILPAALSEMTTTIRELGNLGVHAKDQAVTLQDAQDLDDFFRFIVEYVYVAPAKIERVKFNLDRQKLIAEYGNLLDNVQDLLMEVCPVTLNNAADDADVDYHSFVPDSYEYETFAIVKNLRNLPSKEDLDYFLTKGLEFLSRTDIERSVEGIWDLWEEYKNK